MSNRIQSIGKRLRRLGVNLWGDPKCPVNLRPKRPGQHGDKRVMKSSAYALQLKAKQQFKTYFDMSEKQFRRFFNNASKKKGNASETFLAMLECRLQTFVYRMKWARTMAQARQIASHAHLLINGQKVDIRSIILKPGDVVELTEKSKESPLIKDNIETVARDIPVYIEKESDFKATLVRNPISKEIPFAVPMDIRSVVELYS